MSNFVVGPSRNKIVQAAFEGLRKEQRAEKKAAKVAPPAPDVHKKPAKAGNTAPDVHKKAGKVHTTPAKKKGGRK